MAFFIYDFDGSYFIQSRANSMNKGGCYKNKKKSGMNILIYV